MSTSTRPADLPDYERPPIDEVAIGVQFPAIDGFNDLHVGLFYARVREDYPRAESRPRVDSPIETFTGETPLPAFTFQFQMERPKGRAWLISADDQYLIQVQDTQFLCNWRRREGDYPHFDALLERFWKAYKEFEAHLSHEGLSVLSVQQIEVTYINWIPDLPASAFLRPGSASSISIPGVGPEAESQDWIARYLVNDESKPIARLYAQCQSVVRAVPIPSPGIQFSLVFRAPLLEAATNDRLSSLMELGRNTIVRTFTDLTTSQSHTHWGRFQ